MTFGQFMFKNCGITVDISIQTLTVLRQVQAAIFYFSNPYFPEINKGGKRNTYPPLVQTCSIIAPLDKTDGSGSNGERQTSFIIIIPLSLNILLSNCFIHLK
jgi:hypothetical protein